jgi:hypothetical protein
MSAQQILELAKTLSAPERASVARDLLATLDYPGDDVASADADAAWRVEARRRVDAIVRGDVRGVAADDVHRDIGQRLLDKSK